MQVQTAEKLGTRKVLKNQLLSKGNAQGYQPEVHVLTIAGLLTCGGSALSDVEAFRKDKALCRLLGMKSLPASNTLGDWLRSDSRRKKRVLQKEVTRLAICEVKRRKLKEIILDPDATLFERWKEGCKKTYKGFRGFAPMVVSEAKTKTVWYTEFRAGNEPPRSRALEVLKTSLAAVPDGVKVHLRSDSAWFQSKVLDHCQDNDVSFTITACQDCAVMKAIWGIEKESWKALPDEPGTEIAATSHRLTDSKYTYKLVVIRWKKKSDQSALFDAEYGYHAVITNREETPEETLKFHRGRGEDEHINQELKSGFEAEHVPCGEFAANAVFWMIACLAYNLVQASKAGLPQSWATFQIKQLRFRLFKIAVLVTRTGRQLLLKIQEHWAWNEEFRDYYIWNTS